MTCDHKLRTDLTNFYMPSPTSSSMSGSMPSPVPSECDSQQKCGPSTSGPSTRRTRRTAYTGKPSERSSSPLHSCARGYVPIYNDVQDSPHAPWQRHVHVLGCAGKRSGAANHALMGLLPPQARRSSRRPHRTAQRSWRRSTISPISMRRAWSHCRGRGNEWHSDRSVVVERCGFQRAGVLEEWEPVLNVCRSASPLLTGTQCRSCPLCRHQAPRGRVRWVFRG